MNYRVRCMGHWIGHIKWRPYLLMVAGALLLAIMSGILPTDAFATNTVPDGTCTSDPQFDLPSPSGGNGLISTIVQSVTRVLNSVTYDMFNAITTDTGFIEAAQAMVTIYIAIYGILFTFGMVHITLWDFAIRIVKIGIIALLLSQTAWQFFNNNVIYFFNAGTDDIINQVTSIAVGGVGTNTGAPFAPLDDAIAMAVSAKMAVTLLAIFFTGPYGVMFGLLILMALGSFFKAMMNALWVYLMSLVLKALLFGLAPIFIACILFNRTRHLFDGWLNQVVNASLQPILLFAFFAFFTVLIETCISNLLVRPVCYTHWAESLRGSPFAEHFWRFSAIANGQYQPYGDIWDFTGSKNGGQIFPIDLMTVLTFLVLAEMAGRFNNVVIEIARELAGAATDLRMGSEAVSEWFSSQGRRDASKTAGALGVNGRRTTPLPAQRGVGGRAGGNRGGGGGRGGSNAGDAANLPGSGRGPGSIGAPMGAASGTRPGGK